MPFGIGSKKSADKTSGTGSKVTRVNDAVVTNQGLARYETDHKPAETRLAAKEESKRKTTLAPEQRDATRANSRHTAQAPAPSNRDVTRATSRHTAQAPAPSSRDVTRASSRHTAQAPAPSSRDVTRATSRRTSRGPAPPTTDMTRATSRHASQGTSLNLPTKKPQPTNNGPTTLNVHEKVARAVETRSTPMPKHRMAFVTAEHLKKQFGTGPSDPRSLDEILGRASVCNALTVSDMMRARIGVLEDPRPLEEIFDRMERKADKLGPEFGISRSLEPDDNSDDDEDAVYDSDDEREWRRRKYERASEREGRSEFENAERSFDKMLRHLGLIYTDEEGEWQRRQGY